MSKKTVVTIGVVLIILQIASFSGMSKALVGLYPNYDDLMFGTNSVEQSELNAKKVYLQFLQVSNDSSSALKMYFMRNTNTEHYLQSKSLLP